LNCCGKPKQRGRNRMSKSRRDPGLFRRPPRAARVVRRNVVSAAMGRIRRAVSMIGHYRAEIAYDSSRFGCFPPRGSTNSLPLASLSPVGNTTRSFGLQSERGNAMENWKEYLTKVRRRLGSPTRCALSPRKGSYSPSRDRDGDIQLTAPGGDSGETFRGRRSA
jgi:hypothetical protein